MSTPDLFSQAPDPADVSAPDADASDAPFSAGDRLYLCDAFALAYRAHFAFISRPLLDDDGNETSAAYGFTTSLLKLLEDEKPEHIAVVFDALTGPKTYRDELYDQYKAHRPKMPEGLRYCIPFIKRIVEAFDIPVVEIEGVEADDVIGTLAVEAAAEGADVRIVSPDKDFRQLLRPGISMMRPAYKGEEFDMETHETFRETYGVEPPQFVDILALLGDASDNVPGVRGIGKKTAPTLIAEYGTVENLLDHAGDITGKRVREGLLAHREDALMSKKLVTILTDVPHGVDPERLRRTEPDLEALDAIFDELGFGKRLRTRSKNYAEGREHTKRYSTHLPDDDPDLQFDFGPYEPVTAMDEDAVDYQTVYARADLPKLTATLAHRERFAFDTETTSTDPMAASLVGLSAAHRAKKAVYAPTPLPDGTPEQTVLDAAREALLSEKALKIGHNVKYDLVVLKRHGVDVAGPFFDTMVAHYLIEPEASHKLDDVASFYLNYRPQPITDLIGTGKDQRSMRDVPVEDVGPYACEDADVTLRLVDVLKEKLEADGLLEIAETIEFPLVPVLADMEMAGVKIDEKILADISVQLSAELERLEEEVFALAGRPFTIGSPKQLGEVLFNPPPTDDERKAAEVWWEEQKDPKAAGKTKKQLKEETPTYGIGLDAKSKTASGKPSTNEAVLNDLAAEHALPMLVLEWRKVQKLQSTYVDRLPELVHPETGRVHTDFNQTVTATGRLSCLPAGTLVNTERGLVGIETVRPGERVRTPFGPRRVLDWEATGEKPTVVLRLSNGIALRCSPEHRIRSRGLWRRADTVQPGDPVYMTFTEGLFGTETALTLQRTTAYATRKSPRLPERWTPELAELAGYLVADGHIARSTYNGKPAKVVLAFGWEDDELMDRMSCHIEAVFGKQPTRRVTRTCPVLEVSGADVGGAFEQLGAGGRSAEVRVPPALLRAPEPVVSAFLRGYFEGDGCVGPDYGITVRSVSRAMLEDVQQLLTLYGIPSGLSQGGPDLRGHAPRHTLRILGDRSKRTFHERIGFVSERKRQACAALAGVQPAKSCAERLTLPAAFDFAPVQADFYDAVRDEDGRVPHAVFQFASKLRRSEGGVVLSRAEWIADRVVGEGAEAGGASFLWEAAAAGYFEVLVESVERESAMPMYDIAVEDVEQYTAHGIVVHNSSNPNLQNIPIRTERGREIRKAFIAEDGHQLLAADYAQIELRIIAHMSGDESLKAAFSEGLDIHSATAAHVFEKSIAEITRTERNMVKQVNYGIPYGISAFGLAQRMNISNKEAGALIDRYRQSYPDVIEYLDGLVDVARSKGYAETLLGRRRYLPQITSRNPRDRAFAERVALNMPIQGTQADMIKLAMVHVARRLRADGLAARMILQVHDELVFEVPDGEVDALTALVQHEMAGAFPLDVPVVVDVGVGPNWLDAH